MLPDVKKIAIIVFTSFAVGLIYNFVSPEGISLIREETKIILDENSEDFYVESSKDPGKIRALTTAQVYEIFNNKEAKFVDGRDNWDFSDGHIPGAINIPEYKFTPKEPNLNLLDKDEKIIIYCEGDQCEVSKRLAGEFQKLGYKKIWVYLGGWEEWEKNNFPIEKE